MILAAFRVRSFRFQWPADLLTSWAFEMETLILGWYVMVQTGSVLLLTLFGSAQFLGTLAAPMFGVLGDRVGGRLMLCAMRAIYATLAVTVMVLAFTGGLTPAWAIVLAALNGIVRPNDLVMRNALIGETIPPDHLMGALGMSRATMDSARVGGALAGAGLSTILGIGLTYVFVTCFYLASLALTFGVARARPVPDPGAPSPYPLPLSGERDWGWRELKDGVAHILSRPQLLAPMWLAFLINLTAYPASGGLLPYIAQRVYQVDATGLGWLAAAFSFGALLASIAMVVTGGPRHPERYTLVHTLLWYGLLLVFAHVPTPGRRTARAAGHRLRAERRDDLDDRDPAHRLGPGLPRAGHGRALALRLRPPDRADRLRRADRADRLPAHHHRDGRGRNRPDRAHRPPVARGHVGARPRGHGVRPLRR